MDLLIPLLLMLWSRDRDRDRGGPPPAPPYPAPPYPVPPYPQPYQWGGGGWCGTWSQPPPQQPPAWQPPPWQPPAWQPPPALPPLWGWVRGGGGVGPVPPSGGPPPPIPPWPGPGSGVPTGPARPWRRIRSGDTGYGLAQRATGAGGRWRELLEVNAELTTYTDKKGQTQIRPWAVGQKIYLPPGWERVADGIEPSAPTPPGTLTEARR